MHKSISVVASVLFAGVLGANAATISLGNVNAPSAASNMVSTSAGVRLTSSNSFIGVGYFDTLTDAQLQSLNATTFATAKTDFVLFGTSTSAGTPFPIDGSFQYDSSAAINAGSSFINESVYLVVGNASTLSASTELLIYKSALTFLQDNPLFSGSVSLSRTDEVNTASQLLWGQFGTYSYDIGDSFGPTQAYSTVAAVPEPGVSVLAMAGAMFAVLGRRRRRNRHP
ncbi:MYXO-CTERM sorting domain-containing protein [Verrucomicrobium sp. BvORR106]|uniref:MYXO-CTERM sorting domain-containing protein n=1 Tax=Verrucomicrobium sp. BvORR106 TaxID=1403819 RepID=UPI0005710427|nr:MYXO-CTERM sorting domain-containing protein [Verrucomicrobium sp. BvORR106]